MFLSQFFLQENLENENPDEDAYDEEGAAEEGEEEETLEVDQEVPVETEPLSEVVAVSALAGTGEKDIGQNRNKENGGKEVETAKDKPEERTGDNQGPGTNKGPKTTEETDASIDRKTSDENTAKQNSAQAGQKPLEGKDKNDKAGTYLWGCYHVVMMQDCVQNKPSLHTFPYIS